MDITVVVREHQPERALYPRPLHDCDLLVAERRVLLPCPYGADVDGNVIFDVDADLVLSTVELVIPKQRWQVLDLPCSPTPSRRGDLEFTRQTLREGSFSRPNLRVLSDKARTYAWIEFDAVARSAGWVALSERCLAAVEDGCLLAFFMVPETPGYRRRPKQAAREAVSKLPGSADSHGCD